MQNFIAVAATLLLATTARGPLANVVKTAEVSDISEVYVAQMDQDWTVKREVRVPCSVDAGCSVELNMASPGQTRVRLRFEAMHAGRIEVISEIDDASGHAAPQPPLTVTLDRGGFGATHFEAGQVKTASKSDAGAPSGDAASRPVILMAVKVPDWAVTASSIAGSDGEHI